MKNFFGHLGKFSPNFVNLETFGFEQLICLEKLCEGFSCIHL